MTRHREDCPFCRMNTLEFTTEQIEFLSEMMSVVSGTTWAAARRKPPKNQAATLEKILNTSHRMWTVLFGTAIPESDEVAQHRHQHGQGL